MKTRTKKILAGVGILFALLVVLLGAWLWWLNNYVHRHCIKQFSLGAMIYAEDHQKSFPFSTNGFGDALLMFAKADPTMINSLCGPGDDGAVFKKALENNTSVPESACSRIYVQGLSDSNNPEICILFDRNSCKGGDHGRSPWGHFVRETCLLDGSMKIVRDEDWPEFSRNQVKLLVEAGFTESNALALYPAAK